MSKIKRIKSHKKIRIQTSKTGLTRYEKLKNEKERKIPDNSPVLLILYLIGILGITEAANTALNIAQVYFIIAEAFIVILSTAMWYVYIYCNRYFNYIILPLTAVALIVVIANSNFTAGNIFSLSSFIASEISPPVAAVLAYMVVLLIFTLEFISRNHSIMFVICSALFIFGPSVGISFTPVTIIMISAFQFGFLVLNMTSASPRKTLLTEKHRKIAFHSTIISAAILLICFLPAFIAESIYEDDILSHVYYVDGIIHDIVSYFTNNNESGILDGTVNRGNLRQTGEKMFEADVLYLPKNRMYLKAFIGADYNEDNWENAFKFFAQENNHFFADGGYALYSSSYSPEYEDDFSDFMRDNREIEYYYREPFMNDTINRTIDEFFSNLENLFAEQNVYFSIEFVQLYPDKDDKILEIYSQDVEATIHYNSGEISYTWINNGDIFSGSFFADTASLPNYPTQLISRNSDPVNAIYSDGITTNFSDKKNINRICISPQKIKYINPLIPYYSEKNINDISPAIQPVSFTYSTAFGNTDSAGELYADKNWAGNKTYENFVDNYIADIQNQYTSVPYKNMPKLTQLCSSEKLTDLNEITTFILYTLQKNATYSTTPGNVPYNEDIVEHFLFKNHKGYCVHFATAAALMYRMYGIPARYVTGYAVDKDVFKPSNNDGGTANDYKYRADVTDRMAHAWVEIFLKDYGWVPVEVTPTADGEMVAEYPGYDRSEMERIMKKYDWHFRDTDSTDTDNLTGDDDEELSLAQIIPLLLVCLVFVSAGTVIIRRIYIINKQATMNCRQLFDRLIKALHMSGLLTESNGSEKCFADMLCEALPIITHSESMRLIEILQTDNFSEHTVGRESTEFVRSIYEKSSKYLYNKIKWYKKPIFKFIKCLC